MDDVTNQTKIEQSQLLVMAGLLGQEDLSQKPELRRLAEEGWKFKDSFASDWILGKEGAEERILYNPAEDEIKKRYV